MNSLACEWPTAPDEERLHQLRLRYPTWRIWRGCSPAGHDTGWHASRAITLSKAERDSGLRSTLDAETSDVLADLLRQQEQHEQLRSPTPYRGWQVTTSQVPQPRRRPDNTIVLPVQVHQHGQQLACTDLTFSTAQARLLNTTLHALLNTEDVHREQQPLRQAGTGRGANREENRPAP